MIYLAVDSCVFDCDGLTVADVSGLGEVAAQVAFALADAMENQ